MAESSSVRNSAGMTMNAVLPNVLAMSPTSHASR